MIRIRVRVWKILHKEEIMSLTLKKFRKKSRKLSSRSVDVGSSDLEERVGETLKLR